MVRTKGRTRKKKSLRGGDSGLTLSKDNTEVCAKIDAPPVQPVEESPLETVRLVPLVAKQAAAKAVAKQQGKSVAKEAAAKAAAQEELRTRQRMQSTNEPQTSEEQTDEEDDLTKALAMSLDEDQITVDDPETLQKQLDKKQTQLNELQSALHRGDAMFAPPQGTEEKLKNEIGALEKRINALKGSTQGGGRRRKSRRKPRKSRQVKRTKRSRKSFKKPKKNNKKTKRR